MAYDFSGDAGEAGWLIGGGERGLPEQAVVQILGEIEKTLREMRSLAKMAADEPLTAAQRRRVQAKIDYLKKEIDGIAAMLAPMEPNQAALH
ncbi:MAG: hypothetical protein LBJ10_06780 [Clostridiales bacterium]|jgi:hypothetical protein|nr:hypothetical protein [Clostridiales bacterium]